MNHDSMNKRALTFAAALASFAFIFAGCFYPQLSCAECDLGGNDKFSGYLRERVKFYNDQLERSWVNVDKRYDKGSYYPPAVEYSTKINGRVTSVELAQSSGNPEIDKQAIEAARKLNSLNAYDMGYELFSFRSEFKGDRVRTVFLGIEPTTIEVQYVGCDLPMQVDLSKLLRSRINPKLVRQYKPER